MEAARGGNEDRARAAMAELRALDAPFEEGVDGSYGLGLRVGAGLEFTTHWSLELGLTYGTPSEDVKDLEFTSNMLSVHMVVVGKAY